MRGTDILTMETMRYQKGNTQQCVVCQRERNKKSRANKKAEPEAMGGVQAGSAK